MHVDGLSRSPSGQCFSPILFNIYVNQIFNKLKCPATNICVYVDDIIIYISHKSLDLGMELLNNALNNVSRALIYV